jgi:hypothetical protein
MSKRRSKHPRRGGWATQFFPRVQWLEDRTVPATFFLDPALTGATTGDIVTFNAGRPGEVQNLIYAETATDWNSFSAADKERAAFSSFNVALEVANDFSPGEDTIRIAASQTPIPVDNSWTAVDQTTGALPISDPLIIVGSGQGATILAPTNDTQFDLGFGPEPDNLTAVFRVADATLTVTDLTFDGAGKNIGFAFAVRDGGAATFDRVTVRNIRFDVPGTAENEGIAFAAFTDPGPDQATLHVLNSRVENYGLHGISYEDANGSVRGTILTGRGAGDGVNNGIQVIGDSTVLITGNTITGHTATTPPFSSSGVVVDETATGAPVVTLIGNRIAGNGIGVFVGDAPGDASLVTAEYNSIVQNFIGMDAENNIGVNAPNNWWGPGGPFHPTDNPGGLGNPVTDNVNFVPFLTQPTPVASASSTAEYINAITIVGVAVSPAPGQPDPVPSGPVAFSVIFARPVTGFDPSDVQVLTVPGGTPNVTVSGSGAVYTVTINGLAGQGQVAIRIPAGAAITADGFLSSDSGIASVNFGAPVNTPPVISTIPAQTAQVGVASPTIPFLVIDAETPANQLIVTPTSSNPAVVPNANIVLGGTGTNRTISFTPTAAGTTIITVTVQDAAGATNSTQFVVTAQEAPVNQPPTITPIGNQTAQIGTATTPAAFVVADDQTPAAQLIVTAVSDNQAIVPNANIVISGTGANRTISVTPIAAGTANITVTVQDADGLTSSTAFAVTGTSVEPPPPGPVLLGTEQFAVGPDIGGAPIINFYNPDGTVRFTQTVFASDFLGGVRTAVGDVNGDGIPDIAVGSGPGATTAVRVLSGVDGAELFRIVPFEESFTGGVYVALGDLTGDGLADLVITPDEGGGPRARIFRGGDFALIEDFFGIEDVNFRGGARPAIADINGDGIGDLLIAAGFGGGPRVAGFNGASLGVGLEGPVKLFADFFMFEDTLRNGVFIAGGDINGDGFADVIGGGGPGGGPRVFVLSGAELLGNVQVQLANFFAGNVENRGGIRVTAKDLDGDDRADIVVGDGTGAGSRVTAYLGENIPTDGTPPVHFAFDAFPGFDGGVFVG